MKLLSIYNTCGISNENLAWYIECINALLNQAYRNHTVVVSACMNKPESLNEIKELFGDRVDIISYPDPYTVNITFNKTVQECVKKYGSFDGYFYIDSGVRIDDDNVVAEGAQRLATNKYGMITFQTDTDTGFGSLGFLQDSWQVQITGEDFIIPVGKSCNLHSQIFSHDLYEAFNQKLMPDVFRAYCTESTFSFLCSAIQKDWTIVKDILLHHNKGVDGASVSQPHSSVTHSNPWNNLFCNRNALDFINDPVAIEVGLGYEECNNIMNHNPDAFTTNCAKLPDQLREAINKYFFLNIEELDYNSINIAQY